MLYFLQIMALLIAVGCRHGAEGRSERTAPYPTQAAVTSTSSDPIVALADRLALAVKEYRHSEAYLNPTEPDQKEFNAAVDQVANLSHHHLRQIASEKLTTELVLRASRRLTNMFPDIASTDSAALQLVTGEETTDPPLKESMPAFVGFGLLVFGSLGLITIGRYKLDLDKMRVPTAGKWVRVTGSALTSIAFLLLAGFILASDEPSDAVIMATQVVLLAYGSYMLIDVPVRMSEYLEAQREFGRWMKDPEIRAFLLPWTDTDEVGKARKLFGSEGLPPNAVSIREEMKEAMPKKYEDFARAFDTYEVQSRRAPGLLYAAIAMGMIGAGSTLGLTSQTDAQSQLSHELGAVLRDLVVLENRG